MWIWDDGMGKLWEMLGLVDIYIFLAFVLIVYDSDPRGKRLPNPKIIRMIKGRMTERLND